MSQDLAEVISTRADPSDFLTSDHFITVCVVLPQRDIKRWLATYELLDEGVVPRSAKQFPVEDKDGLTLWRVVLMRQNVDSFSAAARREKWSVREVEYNPSYATDLSS